MKSIISTFKIIWGEIYFAVELLKIGGPWVFLKQLMHQIYSRSAQVSFTLDLQKTDILEKSALFLH